MRTVKLVSSLAVALLMPACGGPTAENPSKLVTSAAALTTGVSRGCTFTLSYREIAPPYPPTYVPVITRQASASCPWGAASVELPGGYAPPHLSLAANDLGVAVGYTNRYSPSGSAGSWLEIRHLAPDTLAVVRSVTLQSHFESRPSYVDGELSLQSDGTTLEVQGEKGGNFPEETSFGGKYFVATYPDFFTSTTAPNIVVSVTRTQEQAGTWAANGNLTYARSGHTATLLNGTGDVLVVSGASAEVYNPYLDVSALTSAPLFPRTLHAATSLPSGKVLVTGGLSNAGWSNTAEVFDPATGTWTSAGTMSQPRGNHTMTVLGSGKVLVVGGHSTTGETSSVDVYDPEKNEWSPAAPMPLARAGHTATELYSGKVLVTGGTSASSARREAMEYDPATNTWTTFVTSMPRARSGHLAVRLYSGKVLIIGGGHDVVDIHDPYSGYIWTPGAILPGGASAVSATMLYSGEVLVTTAGGQAYLYDPSTDAWMSAGALSAPLQGHAATMLHTGEVLVTGGSTSSTAVSTVQRYTR
ncbi:kelch repeat-containing protein [Archangium violaceum]|uniref:Kelch repeat-containing protein n=1 Tax=Archangium violaceum TaxID=83451 RepID=UPI00193C3143|nr:kelch repeat-containing protein [Archangium violaceum]QRK04291.1 kelch repeat-containing protein [Archangium violaceum]